MQVQEAQVEVIQVQVVQVLDQVGRTPPMEPQSGLQAAPTVPATWRQGDHLGRIGGREPTCHLGAGPSSSGRC